MKNQLRAIGDFWRLEYGRFVGMTAAAFLVLKMHLEIEALPWSYAVGWFAMLAYEVPALVKFLKSDEL